MKGVKKAAEASMKVKQNMVEGVDKVHDASSNASEGLSVLAISTTGTPVSPFFAGGSSVSGIISAGASGLNWTLTGDEKYRNNFYLEIGTLGFATGGRMIKSGKTLTPTNAKYLKQIYEQTISTFGYGIGLIGK